jgi:hypothetical protein
MDKKKTSDSVQYNFIIQCRTVGMAQSVQRRATGWTEESGFESRQGHESFLYYTRVQTGSAAHPVSHTIGTVVSFPGGHAAGA